MTQRKFPAVFMRGGTSKALMFHARDLPAARAEWDAIFLSAMGSPDPHGRQLDGMGGGISSLSKVCVIAPSPRADADIDYTFAQVQVKEARARTAVPFIGFVSPAQDAPTLSGECLPAAAADVTVRMISNGQPHRALPLTASLCAAVAARIVGTTIWQAARRDAGDTLRLAMPSGVLTVGAEVRHGNAGWNATRGSFYRTARRLFESYVYA
jgi:2-methylaconitate cis-trans-isomerase PrpF